MTITASTQNCDIHTAYAQVERTAESAKTVADGLFDRCVELESIILGIDTDAGDEEMTVDRLADILVATLTDFTAKLEEDRAEAERCMNDAGEAWTTVENLQYDYADTERFIDLALDVERGIRDPEELSRLVHDCADLAF
jgi:hypothetical protein